MEGRFTAQDILHARFKKSMRGYDTKEVDYFLDEIAESFEHYNARISQLEAQAEKDKERLASFEQTQELMQSTLLMAQKSAEARVEKARAQAGKIIADAEAEAQDIRAGAKSEKAELCAQLENIKKVREEYMAEAKGIAAKFAALLEACEKPTETAQAADEFIKSVKAEEERAEPKAAVGVLRFEYEEEQPAAKAQTQKPKQEFAVEEPAEDVPEEEQKAVGAPSDEFRLLDSEELIRQDAQAEKSAKQAFADENETDAGELAQAEKTAYGDENQANLFGSEEEPTKLAHEIRYAASDDLEE